MAINSRKGFFYTTTALIFIIVIITVFYTFEVYKYNYIDDSIEKRVTTMDDFIDSISADAERAAYISAFRTLIVLDEYVSETGLFLDNTEETFKEAFYNGTIGDTTPLLLENSSFSLYVDKVNQKSNDFDIFMNLTVTQIDLSHSTPWTIRVDIHSNVIIVDLKGLASWNFNETFTTEIPIDNLNNPLYTVNTLGKVKSFIVRTNITVFVDDSNDTTNLMDHIIASYYKPSNKSPSYLMRFENNLSSNEFGIENLVDLELMAQQDGVDVFYNMSIVDYIYFGQQTEDDKCDILNMPSWFRIDEAHLEDYEINQLSYNNCTT